MWNRISNKQYLFHYTLSYVHKRRRPIQGKESSKLPNERDHKQKSKTMRHTMNQEALDKVGEFLKDISFLLGDVNSYVIGVEARKSLKSAMYVLTLVQEDLGKAAHSTE